LAYFGVYRDAEFGYVFHLVLDEGAEFFEFGGEEQGGIDAAGRKARG
jgi:hypothetical protein